MTDVDARLSISGACFGVRHTFVDTDVRFRIDMTQQLRIAICQFPVAPNIASNGKFIRRSMNEAADAAARVVHFPETALSGYERVDFTPFSADNWQCLKEHTKEIVELAGKLGLWVVLGSCRRVAGRDKPANWTHVISNT